LRLLPSGALEFKLENTLDKNQQKRDIKTAGVLRKNKERKRGIGSFTSSYLRNADSSTSKDPTLSRSRHHQVPRGCINFFWPNASPLRQICQIEKKADCSARPRPSWCTRLTREFAGHGPDIADPIYSGARPVDCSARLTAPTVTHSSYWGSSVVSTTLWIGYIRMLTCRGFATSVASSSSTTFAWRPHGLSWMAGLLRLRPPA
jgi:hypothetical protein